MSMEPIVIHYRFECEGDNPTDLSFELCLDPETLERIRPESYTPPEWARLDNGACATCPLDTSKYDYCPAAAVLAELGDIFGDLISYTTATVTATSEDRTVSMTTTVQRALRSLMGLYMAASGCPVLGKFKPMARFHLPFSTTSETLFRSAGSYLLAQHFLRQRGEPFEFDLKGLSALYEQVHVINAGLARRFRHNTKGDANINALALLDLYAHALPNAIKDNLAEFDPLFDGYVETGRIAEKTP